VKRTALLALLLGAIVAPAAQAVVLVTAKPARIVTKLGHRVTVTSTIVNDGPRATGYIAHLNVLSLAPGVYVDPEDWSSHRTRYLPAIPAHGRLTLRWRISAVNAGSIGVYVTVLRRDGGTPATSRIVRIAIADRRTLDAGGILPLVLGLPAALALLALAVRLRRR
jgi:hypothetical protein